MINVKNLSVGYESKLILENIDFRINQGEMVSIVGPNGSGKSTLLKVLSGNLNPVSGEVLIKDIELNKYKVKKLASVMAFLPQVLKLIPQFTVKELVSFGRFPFVKWNGSLDTKDQRKIDEAIDLLDLEKYKDRLLAKLSGGERQRARIAMTFAQDTDILLLDEPNTFLDISHQYKILEVLAEHNRTKNKTIVMVLHDLNQALRFSDRVIVLDDQKIYADGKPETVLNEETLKQVFNINALVESVAGELEVIIPVNSR